MRQRVKLFKEVRSQTLNDGVWVDDPQDGSSTGEEQINAWLDLTGASLVGISMSAARNTAGAKAFEHLFYVVTYTDALEAPAAAPAMAQEVKKVPLMWATVQTPGGPQKVRVSTGFFGVIPGTKMHPDDDQAPPLPLLSPIFDWRQHEALFA